MRDYDPAKPLISLHVPKCAGSSFRKVLEQWYGRRIYWHYFSERESRMPKRVKLKRGVLGRSRKGLCIHGHFNNVRGFGVQDYYPDVNQFITILRDPFELHLSNYFYLKRVGAGMYREAEPRTEATDEAFDLQEYLKSRPNSFMLNSFPFDLTMNNFAHLLEQHFVYIGVTEDLQTSIDRLAGRLGFDSLPVPVKNQSTWTEDIPQGARESFIQENQLAWAVYEFARERYRNV